VALHREGHLLAYRERLRHSLGRQREDVVIDAVGPESFGFEELVGTLAAATGTRWWPIHLPPAMVGLLLRGLSVLTRDVVLTRDEIDGLTAELVMSHAQTSCPTKLTDYLRDNADAVGRRYQSELARRRPSGHPPVAAHARDEQPLPEVSPGAP
jgi:NADH dehydrogenase